MSYNFVARFWLGMKREAEIHFRKGKPLPSSRKKVVVFTSRFIPGSKAGGPIRSLDAVTAEQDDRLDFYVVTSDRDLGDTKPYVDVAHGHWVSQGSRSVFYVSPWNVAALLRLAVSLRRMRPDLYYLNSLWSIRFTVFPMLCMLLRLIPRNVVVVAPRGETLPGALTSSSVKKRLAIPFYRRLFQVGSATLHTTSVEERSSTKELLHGVPSFLVDDAYIRGVGASGRSKRPTGGALRVMYVSRIHPHKNLLGALTALAGCRSAIELSIAGQVEDPSYFERCRKVIDRLPANVSVRFLGHLEHDQVQDALGSADVFILPTKSENFGHVIREALAAGCVPLISDQTPWSDLVRVIGLVPHRWDDVDSFSQSLEDLAQMTHVELDALSARTVGAYHDWESSSIPPQRRLLETFLRLIDEA